MANPFASHACKCRTTHPNVPVDVPRVSPYLRAMTYPDNVQDMIDDFAFLDDWEARYMHVIDLGKSLPPLPPTALNDANKVKGCASQVWLVSARDGDLWQFSGESDAHIVKGLVAIVMEIYSNRTGTEIAALDANAILGELGLSEHLSSQRANGLAAMVARIKTEAAAAA